MYSFMNSVSTLWFDIIKSSINGHFGLVYSGATRCQPEHFWHVCRQTTSTLVCNTNCREEAKERERETQREKQILSQTFTFWAKTTDLVGCLSVTVWLKCNIIGLNVKLWVYKSNLSPDWKVCWTSWWNYSLSEAHWALTAVFTQDSIPLYSRHECDVMSMILLIISPWLWWTNASITRHEGKVHSVASLSGAPS